MRFCDFLHIIHKYVGSEKTQADFVIFLTTICMEEPKTQKELEEDEKDNYNPIHKLKARTLEKIYTGEKGYKISSQKARILKSRISFDSFKAELQQIGYDGISALINDLKEYKIKARHNNYDEVCAKTYLSFLDKLCDGTDTISFQDNSAKKTPKTSNEPTEAKRFIIYHEDELELLPLCMIADNINPMHKHKRALFNDYALLTNEAKEEVCIYCNERQLSFNDNWVKKSIELFKKEIKEQKLCREKDFLYDGAKYLHRALQYSEADIKFIDPYIFKKAIKSPSLAKLLGTNEILDTIGGYMQRYYDIGKKRMKPPLDYLWDTMNLGNCSEPNICFWVMRFIISSCYIMPTNKEKRVFEETNIETFEDMYYYSLYQLYLRYIEEAGIVND